MHDPIEIAKNIYWIGVNDYETDLFEAQWPLPEGVSYNSYLIAGDKTVLIDTVKKTHLSQYVEKIRKFTGDGGTIDYLVINHMEPDHSGAIPIMKQLFPEMNIVGNKKTIDLVKEFFRLVSEAAGEMPSPARFRDPALREEARRFFELKLAWPFRSEAANRFGKYSFDGSEYAIHVIDYGALGCGPSRFDRIFLSLQSEFASRDDLRAAEEALRSRLDAVVRRYRELVD